MPDLNCCFELFGFDVMIDSNLKPWLLEVNSSPAMSMDGPIDWLIKPQLIKDVILAANIQMQERETSNRIKQSELMMSRSRIHNRQGTESSSKERLKGHGQNSTQSIESLNMHTVNIRKETPSEIVSKILDPEFFTT